MNSEIVETMKKWANAGVKAQVCVTSPPYFGLRDYGHEGQIGLEQTPEEYVAVMMNVFRYVREVLADDGTVWLNIGDSNWSASLERETSVEAMWGNRRGSDLSDGRKISRYIIGVDASLVQKGLNLKTCWEYLGCLHLPFDLTVGILDKILFGQNRTLCLGARWIVVQSRTSTFSC